MLRLEPMQGNWKPREDGRLEARDATGNLAFILDAERAQIEFKKGGVTSTFNLGEAVSLTKKSSQGDL